uniref:S66 family peptidase n=1 Tax=Agathobacter sp. TaxID=2021311 RepID=UPI004055C8BD
MKYPKFLQKNGTIGFVAPSFGCVIEPYKSTFDNALKTFRKMGYQVDLGPNCYESKGIGISNEPKLCAEELNEWYCSDKNDILIACGGGELMCEVIPFLDFERMKNAQPKWYMGLSDNTNFTFLSNILMDTAAIYGPNAPTFGMEPWHESVTDAFDLICGKTNQVKGYQLWEKESLKDEENPLLPYNLTEPVVLKKFPDGDVELKGRLIGGCLDILVLYPGTSYDKVKEFSEKYKEDGIIWFLEACDLNIMGIRRALWKLKEAGWFRHVKGFLIGRPLCFGMEMFGCDQYKAVTDVLWEFDVPIIMDVDFGHLSPKIPFISGSTANIRVTGNQIDICYTFQ